MSKDEFIKALKEVFAISQAVGTLTRGSVDWSKIKDGLGVLGYQVRLVKEQYSKSKEGLGLHPDTSLSIEHMEQSCQDALVLSAAER